MDKIDFVENEISKMEETDLMKSFKEMELAGYKQALTVCEQALEAAKLAATNIVDGLNQALDAALENMEEFYNTLPSEIKTEVTNALTDLETKINTAKDKAFEEFETKYKSEIESAFNNLKTQKQTLIDSLKKDGE